VQRWNPRLFAHAQQLTGRSEVAADLTQETWLVMVRNLDRLNDPARFRAWAFRILANKVTDWHRRQRLEESALATEREQALKQQQGPPQQSVLKERLTQLRRAIRQLPPDKRALLTMSYVEGLSHAEIADALRIPEGTVKSRLFHIRQQLREQIEENSHE
jgi:RNA polymerase sigma-70 factor (ECF subfamily)